MLRMIRRSLATLAIAGLLAAPALAGGEGWVEDFDAAKQTASTEGKDLLIDFTGSDWCGWCIKLNEEVFSHDEFKDYAKSHFVLVELDYPRSKPQTAEIKAQNAKLRDEYGVRGYPTIILADAQGRPYAQTGYRPNGPEAYVEHLKQLQQIRVDRDEQLDAAKNAQGVEKAKHLHEAMQLVGDDIALTHYGDIVDQIIKLDADNQAGLKKHYQDLKLARSYQVAIENAMKSARTDAKGTVAKFDEMLKDENMPASVRQEVYFYKSNVEYGVLKDKAAAKASMQKAIDAAPESEFADKLRGILSRYFGDNNEG